jgi:hypothetical protein
MSAAQQAVQILDRMPVIDGCVIHKYIDWL